VKSRLVVIMGVGAVVLVFLLPPVGLVLGVVTVVLAARQMKATRPQPQELLTPDGTPVTVKVGRPGRINAVFGLVLGVTATALGTLLLVLLVAFWSELNDYTDCSNGALTTQGETRCKDALKDAVLDRIGQ